MMMESSPATKKAVADALKKMQSGQSDKKKTRADTDAMMAKRRQERKAAALEAAKRDLPNLSALEKQHAEMKAKYEKLGGSGYQYADREQNLSEGERQARAMESGMNQLESRIGAIKAGGYSKGGKISLKDCSVSTASKGKKNSDW
jgi:hypothetical protein